MKDVFYELIEETCQIDGRNRTSFGIAAYIKSTEGEVLLNAVHDLGFEKGRLVALVDQCNRLKLSVVHLYDVLEDFLSI